MLGSTRGCHALVRSTIRQVCCDRPCAMHRNRELVLRHPVIDINPTSVVAFAASAGPIERSPGDGSALTGCEAFHPGADLLCPGKPLPGGAHVCQQLQPDTATRHA